VRLFQILFLVWKKCREEGGKWRRVASIVWILSLWRLIASGCIRTNRSSQLAALKALAIKLDYSLQKGKFLSLSLSLSLCSMTVLCKPLNPSMHRPIPADQNTISCHQNPDIKLWSRSLCHFLDHIIWHNLALMWWLYTHL
jgi:hypothetical protein